MILIDSNSLVVLILGLMNPTLIGRHSKTSAYDEEDFYSLLAVIEDIRTLIILPNIWTEVDNLLNKFKGDHKELYIKHLVNTIKNTSEKYFESHLVENCHSFYDLGLTDTLILECAKNCRMLITSDSTLSDYAKAYGILVYDLKEIKNVKLRQ